MVVVVTAQFADSGLDLSLLTMGKLKIHTSFDPVNSYKGTLGIKKVARYLDISSVSSKTTHLSKRDDYFRLLGMKVIYGNQQATASSVNFQAQERIHIVPILQYSDALIHFRCPSRKTKQVNGHLLKAHTDKNQPTTTCHKQNTQFLAKQTA